MSSIADTSMLGSTMDGLGSEDNTLCFNDSDFYLNMDDVDIGPQIGQGAFSKVYLGRYLGELVSYFLHAITNVHSTQRTRGYPEYPVAFLNGRQL